MYKYLFETLFSVLFDTYLGVELWGHTVVLCLISKKPPNCLPQCWCHFTFQPAMHEGSYFNTSSPTLVISHFFGNSYSSMHEMVSHCGCFKKCYYIYLFIYLFIYYFWLCWVFVSVRGLSPVAASGGPLFIAVRGPLTIAASLVAEHRLQTRRLSSCGSRA